MSLDIRTLFIMTVVNSLLLATAQLTVWLTQRNDRALVLWSLSNFVGAAGSLLVAMRGIAPDVLSIAAGNALIIAWMLLMWAGTRRFDGLSLPAPFIAGGAMAVFAAMLVPAIGDDLAVRTMLIGLLNGILLLAVTVDLWRAQRTERLAIRRFLIFVFITAAIPCFARVALSAGLDPHGDFMRSGPVQAAILLHMNLFILGWNVGGLLMVNERMQNTLSRAATTDALTGLLNRAEFFERADRWLARARVEQGGAAMLMIGIRYMHAYNVQLGSTATDEGLRMIAATLSAHLRPADLLCYMGGEQFALLLTGAHAAEATLVAERLCADVDQRRIAHAGTPAGVANALVGIGAGKAEEFASARALAKAADAALLLARQAGSERVTRFVEPKSFDFAAI